MTEQEKSAKFLPAFFVDVVEVGQEFESGELPLKMTYFPPVETAFDPRLAKHLRRLINPMPPFEATIGHDDMFGDNHDIPVRHVIHTGPILAVHRALVSTLQHLPHATRYRTPYNPHITPGSSANDPRIQVGQTIEMGGLAIVEKTVARGTWQVLAKIGLKGGLE